MTFSGARASNPGYCRERFCNVFCTSVWINPVPISNTSWSEDIVEAVAGLLTAVGAEGDWLSVGGVGLSVFGCA